MLIHNHETPKTKPIPDSSPETDSLGHRIITKCIKELRQTLKLLLTPSGPPSYTVPPRLQEKLDAARFINGVPPEIFNPNLQTPDGRLNMVHRR